MGIHSINRFDRLYEVLISPTGLVVLVVLVSGVSLASFGRYPAIGGDDLFIAAPAYHLASYGTLAATIHRGGGYEIFDCLPPVLPVSVALSYVLFGFGVIQTKLPGLLYGLATALLVFICGKSLGGARAARAAALIFITDPVTYQTWQSGRNDAPFTFFLTAAIAVTYYCSTRPNRGYLPLLCAGAGGLTGLAALAYYPFAAIAVAVCGIATLAAVSSSAWQTAAAVGAFIAGLLVVCGSWVGIAWSHLAICEAQLLPYPGQYFAPHAHGARFLSALTAEAGRYRGYALGNFGFANLALGLLILYLVARYGRERWQRATLLLAPALFIIFLVLYGSKYSRYMLSVVMLWSLGLAFVEGLAREKYSGPGLSLVRPLFCFVIILGVVRTLLVAFTLAYQWNGRDYAVFEARIRSTIAPNSYVIAPQAAWYPLASWTNTIWVYTQTRQEPNSSSFGAGAANGSGSSAWQQQFGETLMNDPGHLDRVQYVILSRYWGEGELLGLRSYMNTHFRLAASVRLPFTPLPWAKVSPFDVDIYGRVSESSRDVKRSVLISSERQDRR